MPAPTAATGAPVRPHFWTPVRIVMVLMFLALGLHYEQKAPCSDGNWKDLSQYTRLCYTDVLALYYAEGLGDGAVPYRDHPVEYPVLTGAFMGVLGLPIHAYAQHNQNRDGVNQGQEFYRLNAIVLSALALATLASILALRRKRPWDGAMFAVAPGLLVSATVNWDLLVVGLTALFMLAWARQRPVLAGILLGLAISAKFYPLLLLGPLLLLAARSRQWRQVFTTFAAAVLTWLALNLPVALAWPTAWRTFFVFNSQRGIDWGTMWYIGAHLPTGDGQYGLSMFSSLDADPTHSRLNAWYLGLFLIACAGITALTLLAPRRPRFAQLAFLVVAVFLVVGKVWSQQYVLWLLPLAVLARPRWRIFLAWQLAEAGYFVSFYAELMNASGRTVAPEWVFTGASALRIVTVCVLMGSVVHDVLRPQRDVVRTSYDDDPDGGIFDGAADATWVTALHRALRLRPASTVSVARDQSMLL